MSTPPPAHIQFPPSFPISANSSFSDVKSEDLEPPPSSKAKNGATGPAEGKAKPHLCTTCHRSFTTGGHLQRHMRIHTGIKAFKCPHPGCETRTSRQDNLQQHYRTHLSPTLRRGSGSSARAAVNAAMEAAGLKSSSRAPRKSKGSGGGTPSSASAASTSQVPSPYATPTSQGPNYPTYYEQPYYAVPLPTNSANSSRVPSPINGQPVPQYYPQPFPPMYYQQYRYNVPYAHPMYPMPEQPMYMPREYGVMPPQGMVYPRTSPQQSDEYRTRPPSPRRRSHEFQQGVVDPSAMRPQAPYGHMPYNYQQQAPQHNHRTSLSSASDGSNGGSEGSKGIHP